MKKKTLLLASFLLLFIIPFITSYIRWGGTPAGYGYFPAKEIVPPPPFNVYYFTAGVVLCLFISIFLLFPQLFGFKKADTGSSPTKVPWPKWFKPAMIVWLVSWFLMWARIESFNNIDHFTFVPLWWGFIFVLDALVYRRNNGVSLWSSSPKTMRNLALVSSVSWFVFEFQNFFVLENWYYPNDMVLTNFGNITWQLLSYTTVLPAIFEWYWLLRTFKKIENKYKFGPKISFSKPMLRVFLLAGLLLIGLMGYFPHPLFWVLWVSLTPVLVPAMNLSNLWTPFNEISKKGDWSPVLLVAIATLLNGFFWEFWNFGSEWFHDSVPTNPNYWKYSVPYLDKIHIFSEMPILGYFGYLLFGIGCWALWLTICYLLDINPQIDQKKKGHIE
jgi:hypothetical protein